MLWTKFSRIKFDGFNLLHVIEGFKELLTCQVSMGPLMLHKFIFKSQRSLLQVINTPSNTRHILCNCKQLLIKGNGPLTFLLACQGLWPMQECCICLQLTIRLHWEMCSMNKIHMNGSNLPWLGTRDTCCYHGWWYFKNKLKVTLFARSIT
jgi:hypothetical protein